MGKFATHQYTKIAQKNKNMWICYPWLYTKIVEKPTHVHVLKQHIFVLTYVWVPKYSFIAQTRVVILWLFSLKVFQEIIQCEFLAIFLM